MSSPKAAEHLRPKAADKLWEGKKEEPLLLREERRERELIQFQLLKGVLQQQIFGEPYGSLPGHKPMG